jgi:hypothetical protein
VSIFNTVAAFVVLFPLAFAYVYGAAQKIQG